MHFIIKQDNFKNSYPSFKKISKKNQKLNFKKAILVATTTNTNGETTT
jgi:hypothetical protein